MRLRATLLALIALMLGPASAAASSESCWHGRLARAGAWADARAGTVSIALMDPQGRTYARHGERHGLTASLLKPLVMTAFLRAHADRPLTTEERALLAPMIRRSANEPVGVLLTRLPRGALQSTARAAGMRSFHLALPIWGLSQTTALDQVRFFSRLDALLPPRHRAYARSLLGSVVPSQRWGIPQAAPTGWHLLLKGGWGSGTGRVVSQTARLERSGETMVLSILTEHDPDHGYGASTLAGVTRRLLRPVPCEATLAPEKRRRAGTWPALRIS